MCNGLMFASNIATAKFLRLGACEIAVLRYLAFKANPVSKEAYPSMSSMVDALGLSERTIYRCLKELVKRGFIEKGEPRKNSKTGRTDYPTYRFVTPDYPNTSKYRYGWAMTDMGAPFLTIIEVKKEVYGVPGEINSAYVD